MLASAGDLAVKLWNVDEGKELKTLNLIGCSPDVNSVAFSKDGKTLAGGCRNQIVLWDLTTGTEFKITGQFGGHYSSFALHPKGKLVAIVGFDNTIQLRDTTSGKDIKNLAGHSSDIYLVQFNQDGSVLASGDKNGTVRLWDIPNGKELRKFELESYVTSVAFSPDGKILAGGAGVRPVKLWDVTSGKELRTLSRPSGTPVIAFNPNGRTLVCGEGDSVWLFNVASGELLKEFSEWETGVKAVAFSPSGNLIASGSFSGPIFLWDVTSGKKLKTLEGFSRGVTAVAFDSVGRRLASDSKPIMIWDLSGKRENRTIANEFEGDVYALAFSPDQETLAVPSGGTINLYDIANDENVKSLGDIRYTTHALAFSLDGKSLAIGNDDFSITLQSVATDRVLIHREGRGFGNRNKAAAFTSDLKYFAIAEDGKKIDLWDFKQKKHLRTITDRGSDVSSLAFSRDGRVLAVGRFDGLISLVDVASGKESRSLPGHSYAVEAVAFNPDGNVLASSSRDGKAKLWNLRTSEEICSLVVLNESDWVVVTPDGRFDTNNLERIQGLHWIMRDDPLTALPLEIFMRAYYEPRLLPRLLANDVFSEAPSLASLNRVQPKLTITSVGKDGPGTVSVAVEVENAVSTYQREKDPVVESGAKDLRLFRDGQLVGYRDGDLFGQQQSATAGCEPVAGSAKKCRAVFEHISLPRQESVREVEFSAYAFNTSDVKSETFRFPFKFTRELPARKSLSGKSHRQRSKNK